MKEEKVIKLNKSIQTLRWKVADVHAILFRNSYFKNNTIHYELRDKRKRVSRLRLTEEFLVMLFEVIPISHNYEK